MEETEEKTIDDLKEKAIDLSHLKDLNSETLRHIDNIVNGVVELRKMNMSGSGNAFSLWMFYLMFLFGGPSMGPSTCNTKPVEEK